MIDQNRNQPLLYALVVAVCAAIFVIDLTTSNGLAIWCLYLFPLLLCSIGRSAMAPLIASAFATGLILVGYAVVGDREATGGDWLALENRFLGLGGLWVVAFVVRSTVLTRGKAVRLEWLTTGKSSLTKRMEGEQTVEGLGRSCLDFLADHCGAQIGAIYAEGDPGAFRRVAGFAWTGDLATDAGVVRLGEGLVGQAAAGKRVVEITDLPDDYVKIRSGVGGARPRSIVLAPMRSLGEVSGIVELGFFRPPSLEITAMLDLVADQIGVAFRSAKYKANQDDLLAESDRLTETLRDQQRELRAQKLELTASNEELTEQARVLQDHRTELEVQRSVLTMSNATLEDQKKQLVATEQQMTAKAAELARASQFKSEFLSNMSHELRTPLNSSLLFAKLLIDNREQTLTADQVDYAKNIYGAGNDLLTLINDILDLSKVEAGKVDLFFEPMPVAALLDHLAARFRPLAEQKQLALPVIIAPGCPATLVTDSQRIQQVLGNLLSNAIKFTDRGSVQLRAAAEGTQHVVFTVEDTGIGIPTHQHEVVFEAFRQADGTTSRKYGGTGLGLSISRELTTLLGGHLRLASQPGVGSSFSVIVPVVHDAGRVLREPTPAAPRRQPDPPPAPAQSIDDDRGVLTNASRTVLVIEDDFAFATVLRNLAHELEFTCVVAGSAEEGLRLARELRPLAVLLDVGLPDRSGLSVLEIMKRSPATRHVPIHMMSGHDYVQVAKEMGAVGYMLKPVKREELVDAFRLMADTRDRPIKRVLIVEDDAAQRDALTRLVGGKDITVTAVSGGDAALEALRHETFDCMVLDLMMPGVSGFELLERMSVDATASFPPVIVYTARALSPDEELLLRKSSRSIVIKGARSPERLIEEVTLFLHQVEAELPVEKQRVLRALRDREAVFEGRRILLVEDDVRNVFALTSILQGKGLGVEIARNGREALERLDSLVNVDLVLMDIMMPEMDGLEAMRAIRAQARWASLPIIALTAKAMPDDRQECIAAGANDYLSKPIDVDSLFSQLRVWMPHR